MNPSQALPWPAWRRHAGVTLLILSLGASPVLAGDWTQWRGPSQIGATPEQAPVTKWSIDGENVVWKSDVGGRSIPIVMNGRVFVMTPIGEGRSLRERIVCLDEKSGKTLWERAFPVYHTDIVENRVGFTALAGDPETGNIYAHGTGGDLLCFDRDGNVVWKQALTECFGRVSGYGGRLHTPILDEDRLILSFTCGSWGEYAKPAHRYYAFDKRTGAPLWSAAPGRPPNDTTCACPVIAVINGRRLLIAPNVDGSVYAMLSRTGETVWSYAFSKRPLNTMPVVWNNRVYLTHSEENLDSTVMGCVVCIDGSKTGELGKDAEIWRVEGIEAGYAAPALANGRLYLVDNSANLICLDAKDGKRLWQQKVGNMGKGSPVVTADGVVYIGSQAEHGLFWILKDAGDKCEVLDQKEFPRTPAGLDEVLGSPSVANGRVFFQTRYSFYCLGQPNAPVAATPTALPQPDEGAAGEKASTLLLTPHEITLAPGESVKIEPRAYTAHGQRAAVADLGELKWSLGGAKGSWDAGSLTFTAAPDADFSAGAIKAQYGEKTAIARVRVCPAPPFKQDFNSLAVDAVPAGWMNVINKTKVTEREGEKFLRHLAERPAPPLMRVRAYMGPPIEGGCVVTADIRCGSRKTPVKEYWPDMGVINSRYELLLMGDEAGKGRLRLVSWAPIPRLQKDIPFDWQPEKWYRMKFQVKIDGGKALLLGKVWPRDQQEPSEWTIEETDPYPNLEGSPGLYGYANGTTEKSKGPEILWDNVEVTRD